jgi:hypothetical protein
LTKKKKKKKKEFESWDESGEETAFITLVNVTDNVMSLVSQNEKLDSPHRNSNQQLFNQIVFW